MDMWKPFRNSTLKAGNAPQASILYDKFGIVSFWQKSLARELTDWVDREAPPW
jgi:hypothetical protein